MLMQRGMNETLAGRCKTIYLTDGSFAEMSTAFAASLIRGRDRQRTYIAGSQVEPNIELDILAI